MHLAFHILTKRWKGHPEKSWPNYYVIESLGHWVIGFQSWKLKAERERGPDFMRLANAFSALYPKQSEEKRLLDAMLLVIPR